MSKTTKVTKVVKPQVVEDVTPITEKIELPTVEDSADENEDSEKRIRLQLTNILGVNISQARCLSHLKYHLSDSVVDAQIREVRSQMKAINLTDADREVLRTKIVEFSKNVVRISSETPIAVATICDNFVKEFIKHGMNQAIAVDRKNVDIKHLHNGDLKSLVYYSVFKNLTSFVNYDPVQEDELRKERAIANKNKKVPVVAVEPTSETETDEDSTTKTSFITYVENAIKTIKKEEMYSSLRINTRVREYLSDLITELIQRIAVLSKIVVQNVMSVRTMNADHIKSIIHLILADDKHTDARIEQVMLTITDKLKLYQDHIKNEREKKVLLLDDATKAENESLRATKEFDKKKKQADVVFQRAKDTAEKAKTLKKEVELLQKAVVK